MWFTEGFAEFYMRRIAYRAGRISRNDYLWHLNRALLDYAKSPFRDVSNSTVSTDFWKTPDMDRIPYNRGQIIALIIDAQLRRTSRGAKSLDDLVRALLDDVRTSGHELTTEIVLRKIGLLTSNEFESEIRKTVIDGHLPTIPSDAFGPCLRLNEAVREEGEGANRRALKVPQFEYVPSGQSACAAVL
jgi:predicted metalloprotease with PDZ domain